MDLAAHSHDTEIPKDNKACLMTGVGEFGMTERDVPTECGPWEDSSQVRVRADDHRAIVCPKRTGLCGSDMHILLTGQMGYTSFHKPFILGHECAGIVAKVGESVTGITVGDRVALEPGESCLRCEWCKSGHYAPCPNMKFAAAQSKDGTLQGFYILPADLCYKLPDALSLDEGALMEPLSVAVNAVCKVAEVRAIDNVAVFGAGPVGLLTMAVCKAMGARRILVIDVSEGRLEFAKQYAATDIHLSSPMNEGEDRPTYSKRHAELISDKFGLSDRGPSGIDIVLDCSGAEVCIQTGMWLLKRRGKFIQVGNPPLYCNVPMLLVGNRELNLLGVFRYGPGVYYLSIDLVSRGLVDLKPLITHKYPFERCEEAFETTKVGKSKDGKLAIKVVIEGPVP